MDNFLWKHSEVFRNYASIELKKQDEQKLKQAQIKEDEVLEDFVGLEESIRSDPKKLAIFQGLQEKFANDKEYTKKVDKKFVDGVMLLDLRAK